MRTLGTTVLRYLLSWALLVAAMVSVGDLATAAVPEPDAIYYGTVTIGGVVQASGSSVSIRRGSDEVLVVYRLGDNPAAVNGSGQALYVLRVPMEYPTTSGERSPGVAQANDRLNLYVNETLATAHTLTQRGSVVALNLSITSNCNRNGVTDPGEQCDDGNAVNGDCCSSECRFEAQGNVCANDGNPCTDQRCNSMGQCVLTNLNGPTAGCSDSTFCNGAEVCVAGTCTSPGNPCTTGGECANLCNEAADSCNRPAGTACTDTDGNVCTSSACNSSGSCVSSPAAGPCNDGVFCNGADTCSGGTCSAHDFVTGCPGACDTQSDTCQDCVAFTLPGSIKCNRNQECTVPITVDRQGLEVSNVVASLDLPTLTSDCGTQCTAGSAATNATTCEMNENAAGDGCLFNIDDGDMPFTTFGDGELVKVPVTCTQGGTGAVCVNGASAAAPSSAIQPVCGSVCSTFECATCVPGDCNMSGAAGAGDSACTVLCVIGSPPAVSDCTCAADCNCQDGTNIADAICVVLRTVRKFTNDTCVGLRSASGTGTIVANPTVLRWGEGVKPNGMTETRVRLLGASDEWTAGLQLSFTVGDGSLGRARLAKRLRLRGFELKESWDGTHLVVGVLPPTSFPIENIGNGRVLRVLGSGTSSSSVRLSGAQSGSTEGQSLPVVIRQADSAAAGATGE